MSVEAMAWAFRQKLPPKPKIVLLALADQTDETTGRVCYGKTDIRHLAQKCSVGERSLYRYLAALIRNGYAIRESGKERGHESAFWLCLDRVATDIAEWQWNIIPPDASDEPDEPDTDAQDVEGGSAKLAEGPAPEIAPADAQIGRGGLPIRGRPRLSEEHQNITQNPLRGRGSSFSRGAQDLERQSRSIKRAAEQQNVRVFVIQNSRAWDAWVEYRRRAGIRPATMAACGGTGEFADKRGWYLPSLFPPAMSGTDPPGELSDDDAREFLQHSR